MGEVNIHDLHARVSVLERLEHERSSREETRRVENLDAHGRLHSRISSETKERERKAEDEKKAQRNTRFAVAGITLTIIGLALRVLFL